MAPLDKCGDSVIELVEALGSVGAKDENVESQVPRLGFRMRVWFW
jgi:hypothetical protein